jgi:DNA polymerase
VSDVDDLARRYLRQQVETGEGRLFLARSADVGPRPDAGEHPVGRAPAAPPAATGRRRDASGPRWKRDLPAIPGKGMVIAPPTEDLFTDDPLRDLDLDGIADRVHGCTECALAGSRTNAVPGEGPPDARLVVVGEGPGAKEDETGRPFVGRAGELLTDILAAIELPRERVFICNVVKCRPPQNRTPQHEEIAACLPYLYRQLEILAPAVILAMGGTAAQTLLDTRQSLGSLRNKVHEFRGTPLVVTYHPAALLRNPHWKKPTWDDVRIARQLLDQSG